MRLINPFRQWKELNSMLRFKLLVGAALVVLAMGTAVNVKMVQNATMSNAHTLKIVQADIHNRCVEAAKRAKATRPALEALVKAHRLDGDPHATAVWQGYLNAAKKNPIPPC